MSTPTNTHDLKRFLLDQMMEVAAGKQQAPQAKAICNYVQQIYNVANLELKYATLQSRYSGADVKAIELLKNDETSTPRAIEN